MSQKHHLMCGVFIYLRSWWEPAARRRLDVKILSVGGETELTAGFVLRFSSCGHLTSEDQVRQQEEIGSCEC